MDPGQARNGLINNRKHLQGGFTFLEVIVALALLAVAASILIGMEGAAVRRTIRDMNAQQAMLAARRIMASIETMKEQDFNLTTQENRPILDVLQELGAPPPSDQSVQDSLTPLSATIQVDDWILPFPDAEANPMKKILLRVSWGAQADETLEILFLRPLK